MSRMRDYKADEGAVRRAKSRKKLRDYGQNPSLPLPQEGFDHFIVKYSRACALFWHYYPHTRDRQELFRTLRCSPYKWKFFKVTVKLLNCLLDSSEFFPPDITADQIPVLASFPSVMPTIIARMVYAITWEYGENITSEGISALPLRRIMFQACEKKLSLTTTVGENERTILELMEELQHIDSVLYHSYKLLQKEFT